MRWILLFVCFPLCALQLDSVQTLLIEEPTVIPITLEHAVTQEQMMWGLMQRKSLPENSGMTFNYLSPQRLSVWMFNCLIDLSVAYLDSDKVIRETFELKAYPEKMDPKRKVKKIEEMRKYPPYDPIRIFFRNKGVPSTFPAQYILEMNGGWFAQNSVKSGDVALWNTEQATGTVLLTFDVSALVQEGPILLTFPEEAPHSIWAPNADKNLEIAYINSKDKVVSIQQLKKNETTALGHPKVSFTKKRSKYALVANKGWLKQNHIEQSSPF